MADLPLVQHGWLHLLEHSALHGEDLIRRPVNGQAGLLHTAFHVQGSPTDVSAFLTRLCAWLADPRLDALEHERRVLRAEATQRPQTPLSRHLLWRYGARGPGLAGYDEFGLFTANPDQLRNLAVEVFTSGNAALALSGAPPAGLNLPLACGERRRTQAAIPWAQGYPAGFTDPVGGVAVSGTVVRSVAATALSRLLARSLHSNIRDWAGVGYSAWSRYEPVDADTAVVAAGIDVLPEGRDRLVDMVWAIIEDFARGAVSTDDIRNDAQRSVVEMRDDDRNLWLPLLAARETLLGQPPPDAAQLEAEILAVDYPAIRAAGIAFRDSLLLGVDPGVARGPTSLRWLDTIADSEPVQGRDFTPVDYPVNRSSLTIGDSRAQLTSGMARLTVAVPDIAAALVFPDGARALVRDDGYQLRVEPTMWRDGRDAIALIDRMT